MVSNKNSTEVENWSLFEADSEEQSPTTVKELPDRPSNAFTNYHHDKLEWESHVMMVIKNALEPWESKKCKQFSAMEKVELIEDAL